MEHCGESNAECCVLLVGVDRVMYIFRGFCGAQDVGMVVSILVPSLSRLVGF